MILLFTNKKTFTNHIKYNRTELIEKKYEDHIKNLKKNNIDISTYIIDTIIRDNIMVMCKNSFPYNIPNTEHYLLWINPKYKISRDTVDAYVEKKVKNKMYICFENSSVNKSINSIIHYHILIRN